MSNSYLLKRLLTLISLSIVFFFLGNNLVPLTDPDETFYALTAREMAAKGDWLTPHIFNQPQFEKPIFTYWLLRAIEDNWGLSPFAARFFPALFAAFGVLAVYALGILGFHNERRAFWSAVALCTGALYIGMAKTVFTDMVFTVFILYALLAFYWGFSVPQKKSTGIVSFFVFAGLAVLTKGPLGLLLPALAVVLFLLYRKQISFLASRWTLIGLCVFALIAVPWYLFAWKNYGDSFIQEFFYNDHWRRVIEAEHKSNDRFYFYPLTMLLGMFPWTLFLAAGIAGIFKKLKERVTAFEHFIVSWILVVLVVFTCAHSKLNSYILPMFPALALLTGHYIDESLASLKRVRFIKIFTAVMAGFLLFLGGALFVAQPLYNKYLSSFEPVYFLSACLIAMAGGLAVLVMKERLSLALGLLSLSLLPFLATAFLIRADIGPYISVYQASQYLPRVLPPNTMLLASKPYARGVRYHTGQDVAVLNFRGTNYFSPHPVTIFTDHGNLLNFLYGQRVTYALVRRSAYEELLTLPHLQVRVLKVVGTDYVLVIESLKAS